MPTDFKRRIRNYTTSIPASRTIAEITELLVQHGATRVATDYVSGAEGERFEHEAVGLSFALTTAHGPRVFSVPVDVDAVHAFLLGKLGSSTKASRAQAYRVAWRVVKDWLDAQLTLINAGMARLDQVMLPYVHVEPNKTLYQAYTEHEDATRAITEGTR